MSPIFCTIDRSSGQICASLSCSEVDGTFNWYRFTAAAGMKLIQSCRHSGSSPSRSIYVPTLDDWNSTICCRFSPNRLDLSGSNFAECRIPSTNAAVVELAERLLSDCLLQIPTKQDQRIGFAHRTSWKLVHPTECYVFDIKPDSMINLICDSNSAEIQTGPSDDAIRIDFATSQERDAFALAFRVIARQKNHESAIPSGSCLEIDQSALLETLSHFRTISGLNFILKDDNAKLKAQVKELQHEREENSAEIKSLQDQLVAGRDEISRLTDQITNLDQGLRSLTMTLNKETTNIQDPKEPSFSTRKASSSSGSESQGEGGFNSIEPRPVLRQERKRLRKHRRSLEKRECLTKLQLEVIRADRDRLQTELIVAENALISKAREGCSRNVDDHEALNNAMVEIGVETDPGGWGFLLNCKNCLEGKDISSIQDAYDKMVVENNSLAAKCDSLKKELEKMRKRPCLAVGQTVASQPAKDLGEGDNPARNMLQPQFSLSRFIAKWKKNEKLQSTDHLRMITATLSESICEKNEQIRALQETLSFIVQDESFSQLKSKT